jgi:hypothetical protein
MVPKNCDVVGGECKAGSNTAETLSYIDFRLGGRQTHRTVAESEKWTEIEIFSVRENEQTTLASDALLNVSPGNIPKIYSQYYQLLDSDGMNGVWILY